MCVVSLNADDAEEQRRRACIICGEKSQSRIVPRVPSICFFPGCSNVLLLALVSDHIPVHVLDQKAFISAAAIQLLLDRILPFRAHRLVIIY